MARRPGGSFTYDPFGRRASKTVAGTTTGFLYDGINAVQELAGTTPTANLTTGLGVDEIFTRTDSAGARHFLTDPLSSTVALADSTGALPTQYTYQPFGAATVAGTASNSAFQFTGRENDGTGVYFYRARYYSPGFQRFKSEDPVGTSRRILNGMRRCRRSTGLTIPLFGYRLPVEAIKTCGLRQPRRVNSFSGGLRPPQAGLGVWKRIRAAGLGRHLAGRKCPARADRRIGRK